MRTIMRRGLVAGLLDAQVGGGLWFASANSSASRSRGHEPHRGELRISDGVAVRRSLLNW